MKTRLLPFLCSVLIAASAFADSYNLPIIPGYQLIANQLNNENGNYLEYIIPASQIPTDCELGFMKYNNNLPGCGNGNWSVTYFRNGSWGNGLIMLNPGEGAFLISTKAFTLTIYGQPNVPVLPLTLSGGCCYLLSCQTNEIGTFENIIGTAPPNQAKFYNWLTNSQSYGSHTKYLPGWAPGNVAPTAAVGESVWICTPAAGTNSPPPLPVEPIWATNKIVPCCTNWTFDPPILEGGPCGGTNVSITVLSVTTNNGPCLPDMEVTCTWQVIDLCGNIFTGSQTVTVLDTDPPVITCAPDKTVECGSGWSFDTPTAYDLCCSNVTLWLVGSNSTYISPCQTVWKAVWNAMDCCTNISTCTQTVTVVASYSACVPLLSRPGLLSITVWEETGDDSPNTFAVSPALAPELLPIPGGPTPDNSDFSTGAHEYYDVFLSRPDGTPDTNGCCVTILCNMTEVRSNYQSGGNIDAVELDFADGTHVGAGSIAQVQLGAGITDPVLIASAGLATNALGLHDTNCTRLGYSNSVITVCFPCFTSKTVECGSGWTFDEPLSFSPCCTNQLTVLNTVTNGSGCIHIITRTWGVTDCCSNQTICSQIVTVVNTNQTVIQCPSNIVVTSCVATQLFYAAMVSNVCCSDLTVQYSILPGSWFEPDTTTTVYCTATDCCSNTANCSFTVTVQRPGCRQVFNTGMTGPNGDIPLLPGQADPHFLLVSSPPNEGTTAVVTSHLPPNWLPNTSSSKWIASSTDTEFSSDGVYHYQLHFMLCCSNAQLVGRMAADNSAGIYLNNNPVGTVPNFWTWTPINIGGGFVYGDNVLDIYATNQDNFGYYSYNGLRAELTVSIAPLTLSCAGDKPVERGTAWSFDPPTVSAPCCTNIIGPWLDSSNCVDAGPCPIVWSGVWKAMDCCSNIATCTQTVSQVDTTPPFVVSVDCTSNGICVLFSEALDPASITARFFEVYQFIGASYTPSGPSTAALQSDGKTVCLFNFNPPLQPNAQWAYLHAMGVRDLCGNPMAPGYFYFCCPGYTGPANDQCTNGIPISLGGNNGCSYSTSGSTLCATPDGLSSCTNSSPSPDVWYYLTSLCAGTVVVDTCGSDLDTALSVHTGCPATPANEITCNDDDQGGCAPQSRVSFSVQPGLTYRIRVAGKNGQMGLFQLHVNATFPQPVIQCPSNIVVISCTNAQVFYTPTVTSACCSNLTIVCTPPSGTWFAPCTTNTVHCVVTDCCSNWASCDFTVTLRPPNISVKHVGTTVIINWEGGGTLMQADQVTGPWTLVPGNPTSPCTFSATSSKKFYRVLCCN